MTDAAGDAGLTEIHLLGGTVRLYQPETGFKSSMDSVMLAAACPAGPGDRVLDMGTGVGGAAFCVLARVDNVFVTGVELQRAYCKIAKKNIALNNKTKRIEITNKDIRDYEIKYQPDRYDHVICNPPYFEAGHYTPSPHDIKAHARGHYEDSLTLKNWVDCSYRLLKPGGSFTIIHKAEKTDRILMHMKDLYGDIRIIPLWPKAGQAAKRVIVRGYRNSKSPATLHPGIVMHEDNGEATAAAEKILRDGAPIL